jgi:hypothetical protein
MAKSTAAMADRLVSLAYVVIVAYCVLYVLEYTGIISGSPP